ncbi:hypothetical protein D9Q98_007476 [Chlorella vulgaris]|uniref:Pre-mRNA-splicing factor SPF27 n=1 Tax=Chlorella vulgaris TaxID=3077 RepID=A0A9D4YVM9_CHLVU|nr:hypothetical protein D9Q98_007476 [Chlorella vulgaris]
MAVPLALTHGEDQKGWRRNQHLVDSLPYIDSLTPAEKRAVDQLIEEEMRSSSKRPSDYLGDLEPLPESRIAGNELLEKEMARAAAGEAMQAMDTFRYNLEPPQPSKRNDVAAWRAALDNAYAQLEHQYNRLLNLELLLKFGPDAWRAHNEQLAAFVARLQAQLADVRRRVDDLNRERKLQQHAAGAELGQLEAEYLGLVHKNAEIEGACRGLEAEVAAMRDALPAELQQKLEQQQQRREEADAEAEADLMQV